MADLVLYGPTVSTFTRICAIIGAEAGLSWEIIPTGSGSTEMADHHPFMRSPAAYIDGLHFYETPAICSYIDRAHNDGRLHPEAHEAQARMWQWANEQMIAEALPVIRYHLDIVAQRLSESAYLAGPDVSMADYFMYPVIEATCAAPEGRAMVAAFPLLESWWQTIAQRPAVRATAWPDVSAMAAAQNP